MQVFNVLIDSFTRNVDKEVFVWLRLRVVRSAVAFLEGNIALEFLWSLEIPMTNKPHPYWSVRLTHQRCALFPHCHCLFPWLFSLYGLYLQRITIFCRRLDLWGFLLIWMRVIPLHWTYFLRQFEWLIILKLKCFIFFISGYRAKL